MNKTLAEVCDVLVIGSGMGALTAACLLAKEGLKVKILEKNYLPGGCTSAYWRKGFVFESGATTLVGLGGNMPLQYLLDQTGIKVQATRLELPMQVHLQDGTVLNKYQDLEQWIGEAERVFGKKGQRAFWTFCYQVSNFVWNTSIRQRNFPPKKLGDLLDCARRVQPEQLRYAGYAFASMRWLLERYGLADNERFVQYVNEQLLITAQNYLNEVNVLFGATALCYTNYDNYYMPGGLINLVKPLLEYLESKGGSIHLREGAEHIQKKNGFYEIQSKKAVYKSLFLVSGIPINNTLQIYDNGYGQKYQKQILGSEVLNSAFQMGIGFKVSPEKRRRFKSIHQQIHLPEALPGVGSHSIFMSLNHPEDYSRSDSPEGMVASVSTHLPNPEKHIIEDKSDTENYILDILEQKNILRREDIIYQHSSTQKSWEKWTGRAFGFVGGYPQLMRTKPWQMIEARLDDDKAYLCGDTAYPGQGIPGTVLSGIVAYEKLRKDWLKH